MAISNNQVFVLNLMSCAAPVAHNNSTSPLPLPLPYFPTDDIYSKTITSDTDFIQKRRHSVNLPVSRTEYERMKFQNIRTPVKVRRMKNRNQHYRSTHNIKQPGRTNCTQRLF